MTRQDEVIQSWLSGLGPARQRISRILLFGSRARGDFGPDSDYDILVIVPVREKALVDRCHDSVMDTLLATGRLVSPKIFSLQEFDRLNRLRTPFMQEVARDGIEIR